jgi:hypothetical protein
MKQPPGNHPGTAGGKIVSLFLKIVKEIETFGFRLCTLRVLLAREEEMQATRETEEGGTL